MISLRRVHTSRLEDRQTLATDVHAAHTAGARLQRPRVSDDNAYAEGLFRTAKYRPEFPAKGFVDRARWSGRSPILIVLACRCAFVAMASGRLLPLGLAFLELVLVATAVVAVWVQVGRRSVTLGELLSVRGHLFAKIPIHIRLFTARQLRWIRTRRDGGES